KFEPSAGEKSVSLQDKMLPTNGKAFISQDCYSKHLQAELLTVASEKIQNNNYV
ncbi:hypothetical protein P7K49_019962, partial [Saguinus oedipus]